MKNTTHISMGDALDLLKKLDLDGKKKMELLVGSILFVGYKITDLIKLTKRELMKDMIEVKNIEAFQFIQRTWEYLDQFSENDIVFNFSRQYIDKEMKRIVDEYKLNYNLSANVLRKTYAMSYYEELKYKVGMDQAIIEVSKTLGHYYLKDTYKFLNIIISEPFRKDIENMHI